MDGGTFSETKMTGLGVLIRDEKGQVMVAIRKKIHTPLDALAAEAKAMEISIQFTWDMGFREVTFETDSNHLCKILQGKVEADYSVETICESILMQVGSFRFVHFSHVKRQGNKPAHILAQFAKQIGDLVVWLEETPNLTELMCAQDVAPLI